MMGIERAADLACEPPSIEKRIHELPLSQHKRISHMAQRYDVGGASLDDLGKAGLEGRIFGVRLIVLGHALAGRLRASFRSPSHGEKAARFPRQPLFASPHTLRGRECDHDAALAEVGLHELAAGTVVLHKFGRIEDGLFRAFARQRCLQRCDMEVDVGIVCLKGFINAVCCVCYGRFAHTEIPVVDGVRLTHSWA